MSAEYNFRFRIDWNVPRFDLDLTAGYIGAVKVLGIPVAGQITQAQVNAAVAAYIEEHPGSISGLSEAAKVALLQIAEKTAYIDANGQTYYDDLYDAFYPPAVLVSITAVYTQSGTVYDVDSLDSLKSDLVITALYSDSTSEVVTSGYTLSGTLTVGTSTITVTYQDKTATFTVNVSQALPSGYTKYDYIQSKANSGTISTTAGQRIETAAYANLSELSCEFYYEVQTGHYNGACIFGRRTASGATASYAFYAGNQVLGYHLHGNDSTPTVASSYDVVHHAVYTNTANSPSTLQIDDGTPTTIVWANTNAIENVPFALLMNPTDATSKFNLTYKIRVGQIKFTDLTGTVVGYYIPCVRNEDNVLGLYDIVAQEFHTCATVSNATIGNSAQRYIIGNWE